MLVDNGAPLVIPVWIRTAAGIDIVSIHIPLSTNNEYIATRDGGAKFYPLNVWDDCSFLVPSEDLAHSGFTVQSILGIKDLIGDPDPIDGIQTEGEWWQIAEYYMTTDGSNPVDSLLTDALTGGFHYLNGGFVFADFNWGELPQNSIEYYYSSFWFADNSDPEWCMMDTNYCGDEGAELCIDICGTDVNQNDDLHIFQTSGGGIFTETQGGPGGYAAGTWCGSLPGGTHVLTFEIRDNWGGVTPIEITVEMRPVSLAITDVEGFPGGNVAIPVTLEVCDFKMGGMELLIGWDSSSVTLTGVSPTGRIDDGNEYWNIDTSNPCDLCPDTGAVRIVWISEMDNGTPHSPAYVGEEPILYLMFHLKQSLQIGTSELISFMNYHYYDNTIADSSGFTWFRPGLIDGHINVIDPSGYLGDPNMNGLMYEVGDAMLVVRNLAFGDVVWTENGALDDAIQKSSADLNGNGIIEVTDLIRFINIIIGRNEPPKAEPTAGTANFQIASIGNSVNVSLNADRAVAGVVLDIDHHGYELGEPSCPGMQIMTNDSDGVMRLVIYSLAGNIIDANTADFLTIPITGGDGGVMAITEVSASDMYGYALQTGYGSRLIPTQLSIAQNYPNPFNAKTLFNIGLSESAHVTLTIYDIMGREITELVNGDLDAGYHSVTWDASEQSSGVYFYNINVNGEQQTRKMVLLK